MNSFSGSVASNGIRLAYESFGAVEDPVVLAVAGLNCHRIHWPDQLCENIAAQGYRFIRFDNREIGESTWTPKHVETGVLAAWMLPLLGRQPRVAPRVAYDLDTLVLDAVGLLDALGVEAAHWLGFSMGGMIAQIAAADHGSRVLSLTSMMSSPNSDDLPIPLWLGPVVSAQPLAAGSPKLAALGEAMTLRAITGSTHAIPLATSRKYATRIAARGANPRAAAHHYGAIRATGSFEDRLKRVKAPTLIIHGVDDPLVVIEGGRRTAAAIEGATLHEVPGMGHDFPDGCLERFQGWLLDHFGSVAAPKGPSASVSEIASDDVVADHQTVIVGAGFAGIGLGIQLKQSGRDDFVILEQEAAVGGTWRANTYPGCACDVQSHLYSYSFEPNPLWTEKFSSWDEIDTYLVGCVEKHGLGEHLQLATEVVEATYDADRAWWRVTVQTGEERRTLTTKSVVMAVGPLSVPRYPDIKGRESFTGESFHSATWDHGYDLVGKRVAVIGTGASAIQFIPHVAAVADAVSVFQRTPPWILPKNNRRFSALERTLFQRFDPARLAYRGSLYMFKEWGLGMFLRPKSWIRPWVAKGARHHLESQVPDPVLRATLTPDYEIGCKRILISDDYYPAMSRPNVTVSTDAVTEITATGVRQADGTETAVDAIIYGTGFQVDRPSAGVAVRGLGGRRLDEQWAKDGFETYLGTTVSGFPNLFVLAGPNTGIGHTSLVFMIEAQLTYVLGALALLEAGTVKSLDVRPEVQAEFGEALQAKMRGTVWTSGCNSWYLADSGKNFTIWPDYTFRYRAATQHFDLGDYRVETGTTANL